ncbi:MAG: DUF4440 domain-containing protein, partial [Gemmatimonadetes bacterium]|nr:nuclear transport factor 2 family protein [Gemmatimonadota bacterium]NIR80540.1 nuclear transport factor 2 family protein [Gemmatimonadota bacterium]NIT89302.1 nuclear transport factor 2 family protein [Gemmatimonadota bacterium]NIU33110.1 nuclear transport factor 2 family protein [Gemmatimonadota bacterium]NIU37479.1 DUF4440 domain-containing protein [Gemmatimonadota bacterium]
ALALGRAGPTWSQELDRPGDGEPLAAVEALFDAMHAKDTTAMRALFHPEARLMSAGTEGGAPALRSVPIDDFIRAVGGAEGSLLEELRDPEVRVDGRLGSVWVGYDLYRNGEFSHCGVDAFQLFRSPEGWKIIQITDTRRREGCRSP